MLVLLMFGSIKMIHLWDRHNPNVSQLLEKDYYSSADLFNIQDEKWRIAFSIEDYLTSKLSIDERYIKFFVRATGRKDGVDTARTLPFHKCTDADLGEFLPVEKTSVELL